MEIAQDSPRRCHSGPWLLLRLSLGKPQHCSWSFTVRTACSPHTRCVSGPGHCSRFMRVDRGSGCSVTCPRSHSRRESLTPSADQAFPLDQSFQQSGGQGWPAEDTRRVEHPGGPQETSFREGRRHHGDHQVSEHPLPSDHSHHLCSCLGSAHSAPSTCCCMDLGRRMVLSRVKDCKKYLKNNM